MQTACRSPTAAAHDTTAVARAVPRAKNVRWEAAVPAGEAAESPQQPSHDTIALPGRQFTARNRSFFRTHLSPLCPRHASQSLVPFVLSVPVLSAQLSKGITRARTGSAAFSTNPPPLSVGRSAAGDNSRQVARRRTGLRRKLGSRGSWRLPKRRGTWAVARAVAP